MPPPPATWLRPRPQGLFCEPGGFFIDPLSAVDRAVITHAHSDHARPGHRHVLAHPDTLALMRVRLGDAGAGAAQQPLGWNDSVRQNGVRVALAPAGHVRGSTQVVLEYAGSRVVVSGDYKRQPDPTCEAFRPVPCDVFVTEATFALPVFRFPPPEQEIARLLASRALHPQRTHLVGCYALGKCQRVIALLRAAGWEQPIFLHGAQTALCAAYEALGVALGPLRPVAGATKAELAGAIALAPPGAAAEPWARRLVDPVVAIASGWMTLRQRARAQGAELPLILSDHADWDGLLATIAETGAPEIWITHGREDALLHVLGLRGLRGRELRLIGYGEEAELPETGPEAE
jgi:putative mRNA 3-end processing factor